jgi:hypothetical protein
MAAAAVGSTCAVFACSGGGSGGVAPSSDGGADGGTDGTVVVDGPTADTAASADTGISNPEDATPPAEDAPAGCSAAATRADCVKCCAMEDPDGGAAYVEDINACACAADLCGPVTEDGGAEGGSLDAAPAGDGGVDGAPLGDGGAADGSTTSDGGFGTGACTMACGGHATDPACDVCRGEALKADGGACYAPVRTACEGDPACKGYLKCVASCPKK